MRPLRPGSNWRPLHYLGALAFVLFLALQWSHHARPGASLVLGGLAGMQPHRALSSVQNLASELPQNVPTIDMQQLLAPFRQTKVAIILPGCVSSRAPMEEDERTCHQHIMASCSIASPTACFEAASRVPACASARQIFAKPSIGFWAGLRRAVPSLRALGWTGLEVLNCPMPADMANCLMHQADVSCAVSELSQAGRDVVDEAHVVVVPASALAVLTKQHLKQRFIGVDASEATSIPASITTTLLDLPQVLTVLKGHVLRPMLLHNGPSLSGLAHLGHLPRAELQSGWSSEREQPVSASMLNKLQPVLNHVVRFRYPLDSGGQLEHLRFAGAFAQNSSSFSSKRLRDRRVDFAQLLSPLTGPQALNHPLLQEHRNDLSQALKRLQSSKPRLKVQPGPVNFAMYADYLQQLLDTKVVISPFGMGEITDQDIEAILCGCFLVKPGAGSILAFPDFLQAGSHVMEADLDWSSLQDKLAALDLGGSEIQRKADRGPRLLLEMSDTTRYAGALDVALTHFVQL
ncbi:hypothetical protein WJX74_007108 [Apatococcus lobatus]|uniref:Glycosyltransferase n=1 Tax=Apatococcus lobatus TaxID=904363 RepID=A0AAW1RWU2_9CHLO